ncbi:hypothetical protein [Falsihalocynthiibacter arcticus]|uniref:Uncharacterized protein n=1 Tax=Falsihalocynthiibacter arcticus TaxID=1579316 RepID=A0A126UZS2_9RHOB|nr:hypothetical protein [Falsihalocynthiibacter arcticus]AML51571.1 hypothetical protein RC74_10120 [Falsihalocynthiibacter arcticus]
MGDKKIDALQRINLIHWHNLSCPDGSSKSVRPWKKMMANETGVSQPTIANLVKAPLFNHGKGFSPKTLEQLFEPSDEAFLAILGFNSEADPELTSPSKTNQAILTKGGRVGSQDDYVDLCIEYGVAINGNLKEAAQERAQQRLEGDRNKAGRWRSDDDAYWFELNSAKHRGTDPPVPMHHSEIQAVSELFEEMTKNARTSRTTLILSPPYTGVTHALRRLLPTTPSFESFYGGGVHHLHIGALEYHYTARDRLRKHILNETEEQGEGQNSGKLDDRYINLPVETKIARHLHSTNQLLIIHGASAIPNQAKQFIRKLSEEIGKISESGPYKRVSRLVLTTWESMYMDLVGYQQCINFFYRPSIEKDDAVAYFNKSLAHYRIVRGTVSNTKSRAGPRAENAIQKRAGYHYSGKSASFTEFPSSVRYRAFCASDYMNPSPFDPTQGIWSRADSAWRGAIPEISDCVTDIQSDLRNYSDRELEDDLLALRAVSTGLFFLSSKMIKKLSISPISKSAAQGIKITEHLMEKYVDDITEEPGADFQRYTSPLLVRSIIQDDWMRHDNGLSRYKIHEGLGEILHEMASTNDAVSEEDHRHEEVPYEYPWGDGKVVLALESIRHFSRAAASAPPSRKASIIRRALNTYDSLLEDGTFSDQDGNESRRSAGYLSRSHGLHAMKYEALCLLSADGRGKEAPIGTSEKEQHIFFRELGITLTRMLYPDDAINAFDRCLKLTAVSNFDQSYVLAHAVSASILRGDLEMAADYYRQARVSEAQEEDAEQREKIRARNDARSAIIALASGRRGHARSLWDAIAEEGITPFHGDRATSYFDAHLASPITLNRDRALSDKLWSSIERASHVALDHGFEHERLSIDIRKATFARILGYPSTAEAILDHVGLDLAKHSGSEILFREFQLASAETLRALKRPRYAFVAYAWPAFQSLKSRSTKSLIRKARNLCTKLISDMNVVKNELEPAVVSNKFRVEIERFADGIHYPLFSVDLLPLNDDIEKYFMYLADPERRLEYRVLLRD